MGLERLDQQSQRHPDAGAALRKGEVAVAGRIGRQRLWDIADRVYPSFEPLSADEAQRRRAAAAAFARHRSGQDRPDAGEPIAVGEAGVPVTVKGLDGQWRADPDVLDQAFTVARPAVTVRPPHP